MPRCPNVQRRGTGYRFRLRVPDDVRQKLGKTEITKTLPKDYAEACLQARELRVQWDRRFEALRNPQKPTGSEFPDLAQHIEPPPSAGWFERPILDVPEHDLQELARREYYDWQAATAAGRLNEPDDLYETNPAAFLDQERSQYDHRASEEDIQRNLNEAADVFSKWRSESRLSEEKLDFLSDCLRRLRISSLDSLDRGEFPIDPLLAQPVDSTMPSVSIGKAAEDYLADPGQKKTAPKAEPQKRRVINLFVDFIGVDTPINEIKRKNIRDFRDKLLDKAIDGNPRGKKTINTWLSTLSVFFKWVIDEDHTTENPVVNVAYTNVEPESPRKSFLDDHLLTLFTSLPPKDGDRPSRYWVPWIALYTGVRLNEPCQLRVADVVKCEGILCFNFVIDQKHGQTLKTKHSIRLVPIHWHLLELGFENYVSSQKGDQLFPDVKMAASGYRSDSVSKWFGRYRKRVGVDDPGLVFHSFRHTFSEKLKDAGVPEGAIRQLGGWSARDVADTYGFGYSIKKLAEFVNCVSFPGITPTGPKYTWKEEEVEKT